MAQSVLLAYPNKPNVGVDTPIACLEYNEETKTLEFGDKVVQVDRPKLIKALNTIPPGREYYLEREFIAECLCHLNGDKIWIATC